MPQISVIVPIYNMELHMKKCINSVLGQTFQDFELILVDDGSKDKSDKICDEYARMDRRVQVIHKENGGVSTARNAGLTIAKGEYVAFVDADDWLEADYLETLYQLAKKHSVDIACCTLIGADENGKNFIFVSLPKDKSEEKYVSFQDEDFRFSKWYSLGTPVCKIIKRTLISNNNLQFDKTLSIGEDQVFYAESVLYAKCYVVSAEPKYHYYQRSDSAIHLINLNGRYSDVKAWYLVCKMLDSDWKCFDDAIQRLVWKVYDFVMYICKTEEKITKEQKQLIQSAFQLAKGKRHSLARGFKFELLYILLEYNLNLYCTIMKRKKLV